MNKLFILLTISIFFINISANATLNERDSFLNYVLSDTSVTNSEYVYVKFWVLDNDKKVACVINNNILFQFLKESKRTNFATYLLLMKKAINGDTLLPYAFYVGNLKNTLIYPDKKLNAIWKKGIVNFIFYFFCGDSIKYEIDERKLVYYLFDKNITCELGGKLIYFNSSISLKIKEIRKKKSKVKIYNKDGSVRLPC